MATNPDLNLQQAHDVAQALHDRLDVANPTNARDSQTLTDALAAVDTILTGINQEMLAQRTGEMQAVGNDLKSAVKDLSKLRDQLAEIASRIKSLADIAAEVDSLLGSCSQFLAV